MKTIFGMLMCSWCGNMLYRYDAKRQDDEGNWYHTSCQREKETQDMLDKLREEDNIDIGGMP